MCKLCGSGNTLRKSHIIPKFVGRWLKKTSPTPYLRFGGNVDARLQDLYATELLCDDCERRFSEWETKFANEIFYPSANGVTSFRCGPWTGQIRSITSLEGRFSIVIPRKSTNFRQP